MFCTHMDPDLNAEEIQSRIWIPNFLLESELESVSIRQIAHSRANF
jgi:hypothetical protein